MAHATRLRMQALGYVGQHTLLVSSVLASCRLATWEDGRDHACRCLQAAAQLPKQRLKHTHKQVLAFLCTTNVRAHLRSALLRLARQLGSLKRA